MNILRVAGTELNRLPIMSDICIILHIYSGWLTASLVEKDKCSRYIKGQNELRRPRRILPTPAPAVLPFFSIQLGDRMQQLLPPRIPQLTKRNFATGPPKYGISLYLLTCKTFFNVSNMHNKRTA